jgi:hypothetical protein
MSLNFTDDQLKSISAEILNTPADITNAQNTKTAYQAKIADALKTDQGNAVFFSNFLNIITQYHIELAKLTGESRTNYDASNLDKSAQVLPGNIHFPISPVVWMNAQPKLDPSNIGSPTTVDANNQQNLLNGVTSKLALLTAGFTDGAHSTTASVALVGNTIEATGTGFSANQRVVISGGGNSLYATIISVTPSGLNETLVLNIIYAPAGSIGIGASIANFFSGFTNSQREALSSPSYQNVLMGLTADIDSSLISCRGVLSNQLEGLNKNDAIEPEKSEISAEKTRVNRSSTNIQSWLTSANTGTNVGRFGNNGLVSLNNEKSARLLEVASRAVTVSQRLAMVSQAADGTFTGSGQYLSLFKWVDLRINKITGSLSIYYGLLAVSGCFDQQIAALQQKQIEHAAQFVVSAFAQDADGTNKITLTSVSGFLVNDKVLIMANDQAILHGTIQLIADKSLTFDTIIPVAFKAGNGSRVLKQF